MKSVTLRAYQISRHWISTIPLESWWSKQWNNRWSFIEGCCSGLSFTYYSLQFMLKSSTLVNRWRRFACSKLLDCEALTYVRLVLFEHGSWFLITSLEIVFVCLFDLGSYIQNTSLEKSFFIGDICLWILSYIPSNRNLLGRTVHVFQYIWLFRKLLWYTLFRSHWVLVMEYSRSSR